MIKDSELQEKIDEVRARTEKSISEFRSKDEFFAYAAEHRAATIDFEHAYTEIQNNLLPVFRIAQELCEYISKDQDYFKHGHIKHLYHMALVSRMVKNIQNTCGTDEERKESIEKSEPHYGGILYFVNGQKERKNNLFETPSDRGFKDVIAKSVRCSYDDQLTTIYFGALKEDICPVYKDNPACTVNGSVLSWENMKDSTVLNVAAMPLIYEEVKKLCKENGTPYSGYGIHYKKAEQKIQTKIDEFCDIKNAHNRQHLQKETLTK